MKRLVTIVIAALAMMTCLHARAQDVAPAAAPATVTAVDSVSPPKVIKNTRRRRNFIAQIRDSIRTLQSEPFDTTRDDGYWKRALRHGKFGIINDPTCRFPRAVDWMARLYRWGDRTFNSYDTAYVVATGKNWKLMLKNNDWLDSYAGRIADDDMRIFMNSRISTNIGGQIAFMAVSYAYMLDLDNVFGGDPSRHYKWDFTFTCSRFSFEAYRSRNTGTVTIHRFGDYENGSHINKRFSGLSRKSAGFDLYYFLNHRRYSQAAAYCYSKKQIRSAGSWLLGYAQSAQDVIIDFNELPDDMKPYLPHDGDPMTYRYNYRSYGIMAGYAYNWVFHRNWLFNVTAIPSIGINHSFSTSVDGRRDLFYFGYRGRFGLVRNAGNFFYAFQMIIDGHMYHSSDHNFFNSIEDLTVTAGFRF